MLRATLKSLLSRKLRLFLSGLAVVLGVMFVASAMVLTDVISRSFDDLVATAYEDVDVVVTGEPIASGGDFAETEPIPASVVEQVQALPEVGEAESSVVGIGVRAIDNRTDGLVPTTGAQLGTDWTGEDDLIRLREGRGPTADDEVAINAELARIGDFSVGDQIGVLTREPRRDFTVVGIFGYSGDRDSQFGETHVAFTTPAAQRLLIGEEGVFTELQARSAEGSSPEQVRDAIASQIGDDYVVQTGAEAAESESDQAREDLGFFNYLLLGFAGVALFVGAFLVLNTFSIIVAQRLRELALLRAIGASRRQMIGSVLLEAMVVGLLASGIGLGLGIGIGALLGLGLLSEDSDVPVTIGVPASAVIASFAVGLLVTLVAALVPALRAARVAPVAAMQQAAAPDSSLRRLTITGAVVTLLGAGLLTASLVGDLTDATLPMLLGGVLLAFIGVSLLTPLLARPVATVLGKVFSWSASGELGRRNAGRNPRRTAITAAALMVGVALVTAISTIFTSLGSSLERTVQGQLEAELVITVEESAITEPSFDPAVLDDARQLPDVAGVAGFWNDQVEIEGDQVPVTAVDDLPTWQEMTGIQIAEGTPGNLARGELALDERTAERQDLAIGDTLPIGLPRGDERQYQVTIIYERHDLLEGPLLSNADADGFRSPNPSEAFVAVRPGADHESVRAELERLLVDSPEAFVVDRSGYVQQQTRELDEVMTFAQVLLALAMLIAVLGVINTLVLSIIERTRELGLLRAIGLSRFATTRMVTVESIVISLFGALLGIGVGAALGTAIVYALREEGFSRLALPWGLMGTYLAAAVVVGVIAAGIPAIRASRLNVLAAITYE